LWEGALRNRTAISIVIALVFGAPLAAIGAEAPSLPEMPFPEWWSQLPPPGPERPPAVALAVEAARPAGRPTSALVDLLLSWLVTNFQLPATAERPRVEFVPQSRLSVLRFRGLVSERLISSPEIPNEPLADPQAVFGVYDDNRQTIFLSDQWRGETPAEVSVLLHEMVHHLQNLGRLTYVCPQERERLAYDAQKRWLEMFGKSFVDEIGVDEFDVLVRTRCFN
jgi:hypothetical protein